MELLQFVESLFLLLFNTFAALGMIFSLRLLFFLSIYEIFKLTKIQI